MDVVDSVEIEGEAFRVDVVNSEKVRVVSVVESTAVQDKSMAIVSEMIEPTVLVGESVILSVKSAAGVFCELCRAKLMTTLVILKVTTNKIV